MGSEMCIRDRLMPGQSNVLVRVLSAVFGVWALLGSMAMAAVCCIAMVPFALLPKGKRERYTLPMGQLLSWLILRVMLLSRVQVLGETPPPGGAMVLCNHRSWLDALMLTAYTGSAGLAKHEIRRIPFIGAAASLAGAVFIDRRNPESRAAGRRGVVAFIAAGFKIQLFPEGTRTRTGAIAERVHLSLISDCYDAGLSVLPCAVAHTEDALPTGQFGAFPLQRATLYICPVMQPSEFDDRCLLYTSDAADE